MSPSGNPVLDEIDQHHAALSEPAKRALSIAATTGQPPAPDTNGLVRPAVPAEANPPSMAAEQPLPMNAAPTARTTPNVPAAPPSAPQQHQAELARLTTGTTGQSGISQVHNPFLRTLGHIGEIAESTFFPRAAMFTPGTQLHHSMLVRSAQGAVQSDDEQANAQAKRDAEAATTAHTQAETDQLIPAQSTHLGAESESLLNPKPKEEMEGKTIETADGLFQWNPKTHAYDTRVGDAPGKTTGSVHVLPDGTVISVNHDAKSGQSKADVLYKGDPKVPTEVKQLEVNGKPHQVLINAQTGATIKDLGEAGEKPPTVNVNAGVSALDRESKQFGSKHEKGVSDANAQLEKIGEARAMLTTGSAEAQALAVPKVMTALVSGQGSGVRITQAELNSIAAARGIKGDFQAWVSRISSGKRLTPEQSQQLVQVLDDAAQHVTQKRQIANDALDTINSAGDRTSIVKADSDARKKLADFEKGGGTQGPQKGDRQNHNGDTYEFDGTKYVKVKNAR